jgi:Cd2+/Zn2+-exporting ATPase
MKFRGIILRSGKGTVFVSGALIAAAFALRWTTSLSVVSNVLMTSAAVVAGLPIAAKAIGAIRVRHVSIDLLVAVAAVGALFIGSYWEAAAVTFLFDIGGYLETRTMARTRSVIRGLLDLAPLRAVVMRNGMQEVVAVGDLAVGETILVKPGSKVSVDGIVVSGESPIDESAITGESYPRTKRPGDEVYAGTFNQSGLLTVRVTGAGVDTTLGRIIRRVEEAQESKAPVQRFMERFSRWYTPIIITLSFLVFALTRDVGFALTVLVVGCPGALVLSTPVSVIAAIGGAARKGILMKGGAHLEESGRINAIAFDKTGTLTEGKPEVIDVRVLTESRQIPFFEDEANSDDAPEHRVMRWAAVAESGSEHPLAAAFLRKATLHGTVPTPERADALPGRGIRATYSGKTILVGSRRLMHESGVCLSPAPMPSPPPAPHMPDRPPGAPSIGQSNLRGNPGLPAAGCAAFRTPKIPHSSTREDDASRCHGAVMSMPY